MRVTHRCKRQKLCHHIFPIVNTAGQEDINYNLKTVNNSKNSNCIKHTFNDWTKNTRGPKATILILATIPVDMMNDLYFIENKISILFLNFSLHIFLC